MPQKTRKHTNVHAQAAVVRGRLHEPALVMRGTTAPLAPSSRCESSSRCEAALLRALSLARMLPQDRDTVAASADAPSKGRTERLLMALKELEPEMALKIRTLMISGRDSQDVGVAQLSAGLTSEASAGASGPLLTFDSEESGFQLLDYLRRGHAMACAMDIDVDGPLAKWRPAPSPDLDERAWLSFGKQLARSNPEDWQGFGVPEARAAGFSKLYLKLGANAWWSFQAMLDRPTLAGVAKERRALGRRRVKGVSVHTLQALVGPLANGQGRALRRASRAIRARIGHLGPGLVPVA